MGHYFLDILILFGCNHRHRQLAGHSSILYFCKRSYTQTKSRMTIFRERRRKIPTSRRKLKFNKMNGKVYENLNMTVQFNQISKQDIEDRLGKP